MALPFLTDMAVFFSTDDFASVADIGSDLQVPCIFTDERVMMQDGSGMVNETLRKVLMVPYAYAPSADFGTAVLNVTYKGDADVSGDEYLVQRVYRDRLTGLLKLTLEKTADGAVPDVPAEPEIPADSVADPDGGVTILTLGLDESGSVGYKQYVYYKVYLTALVPTTIRLYQLSADIDLLVAGAFYPAAGDSGSLVSANGGLSQELVTYTASADGWVHISVYGYAAGNYTINASVI